jgi:uncharacterized protein (TIGR02118 family)
VSIRNIVLWSASDDEGLLRRYIDEHLPLVQALPGLERASASPLRSRAYSIVAEMQFADFDAMKAAFGSDEGAALIAHTGELETAFGVRATSIVALPPFETR